MTLEVPAAISLLGDAKRIRHLRAGGETWAVWAYDIGAGIQCRFAARMRTGSIELVPPSTGLRTDGGAAPDTSIPVPSMPVESFHCVEVETDVVVFMVDDGLNNIWMWAWKPSDNTVVMEPTVYAVGSMPSQFDVEGVIRRFYVRNKTLYVRIGEDPENVMIRPSGTEPLESDLIRKDNTSSARYAGIQKTIQSLMLSFTADANTIMCFDGQTETLTRTEGLPPGTVAYYSFDDSDFSGTTVLDQSGNGLNGTQVGATITSVAGIVGQARRIPVGAGYYSVPENALLKINGDLSVSFWVKLLSDAQINVILSKAFGAEFEIFMPIATDVSGRDIRLSYGVAGGNTTPYRIARSVKPIALGEWAHVVVVKSASEKFIRFHVNNEITSQAAAMTGTATSSLGMRIGGSTNGAGHASLDIDELVIANQAWDPVTVDSLYRKGVAGQKASVSGPGTSIRVIDSGPSNRHIELGKRAVPVADGISAGTRKMPSMAYEGGGNTLKFLPVACGGLRSFSMPAAITVEAVVYWRGRQSGIVNILDSRSSSDTSNVFNQGTFRFSYLDDGSIEFSFVNSSTGTTSKLRQISGQKMKRGERNYIVVSHTFGSGGNSFLSVNGDQVPSSWSGGGGSETPTRNSEPPGFNIGAGDVLVGLRVSSVAKSISTVRDHLKGRI